eukprot:scaffold104685_cov33-Tisochrysis_lutea.AAC.3
MFEKEFGHVVVYWAVDRHCREKSAGSRRPDEIRRRLPCIVGFAQHTAGKDREGTARAPFGHVCAHVQDDLTLSWKKGGLDGGDERSRLGTKRGGQ